MKTVIRCKLYVLLALILISMIFALFRGEIVYAQSTNNIRSFLKLNHIDSIKITYWPNGDSSENKVTQIKDSKIIESLLRELERIPAKGPGRHVKLDSRDSEYKIEFYRKSKLKGSVRIKANMLDAPSEEGWDFYDEGVDKKFVDLVKTLI